MLWWTLKGSVILTLAFAATALLRRRPAAVRHAVWIIAVGAQLVLPFVPRERAIAVNVPVIADAVGDPSPPDPLPVERGEGGPERSEGPGEGPRIDWRMALIAGSTLVLLRLLFGTIRVMALSRRAQRVTDGEWLSLHTRLCDELQISRPVTLLRTDGLRMPVTWGFLYPTILLPAASENWPDALRRHVLLHELAHVRRADALTQLLSQCALALFWFNPLLWLAARKMRAEAENACDDYVLRDGERPSIYANTLVELVRAHTGPTLPAFATLSVGQRSDLEQRVGAITNPLRDASSRRMLLTTAVAIALVIVLPLSALHPKKSGKRDARVAGDCRPRMFDNSEFRETSGTMTANGRTTHYFFLRPEPGRCLEGSFNLDARFTDDDRDLVPTPGLRALVHENVGGVDRAVYIDEANGRLTYRYLLDGRDAQFDRSWYESVLPDVIRRSYAGVDARAKRVLDDEGIEGFFAEVERVAIVDVRAKYLAALLTLRGTEDDVRAAILDAARRIGDNHGRAAVLQAMTRHADVRVRTAAMDEIELVDQPWRRDVIEQAVPWYLGSNPVLIDAWFRGLDRIDKSSEREALLMQIRGQELPAGVLSRLDAELGRL